MSQYLAFRGCLLKKQQNPYRKLNSRSIKILLVILQNDRWVNFFRMSIKEQNLFSFKNMLITYDYCKSIIISRSQFLFIKSIIDAYDKVHATCSKGVFRCRIINKLNLFVFQIFSKLNY